MAKTIAAYKAVVNNLSLQHNFKLLFINLPGAPTGELLTFLARGVETPSVETMPVEVWWRGRRGEFPGAVRADADWTVLFNIDENWIAYKQLYAARQIVGEQQTGLVQPFHRVAFQVQVTMLTSLNLPVATFTLLDCYIKSLGPVTKTHDADATPDECEVIIHYDNWIVV